jgi:hypothetical protein
MLKSGCRAVLTEYMQNALIPQSAVNAEFGAVR